MLKIFSSLFLLFTLTPSAMIISAGGFDVMEYKNSFSFKEAHIDAQHANISKVLQREAKNTNSVSIWITKDWQEDWYSIEETQKNIIDKGYTPLFIFYWFADEISVEFVKKNREAYFQTLKKFTKYIKKLNGQKIVVFNPEYNMAGVENWDGMNDIFLKSFEMIREDPQVLVGPCVGDFGNYTQNDEPKEWLLFHNSLSRAAKKSDFIAFQEMRALTRNSKEDILNTPNRAYNLSKYLYKTYKKPTMLAYTAISSYGKDGEKIQADVYKGFIKYLPRMRNDSKLMLFGTFHYFDYPGHVGYFKEAEEFFGILKKDGTKKEAYKHYIKLK